jgi:hypothetical protein
MLLAQILQCTYYAICFVTAVVDILVYLVTLKYISKYANEFLAYKGAKKQCCFQFNKAISLLIYLMGHILKNTLFEVRHMDIIIPNPDGQENEKPVRGLVLAFLNSAFADSVYSFELLSQLLLGLVTLAIIDYFGSLNVHVENQAKVEVQVEDAESDGNS